MSKNTIVTAASSAYFYSLCQFVYSYFSSGEFANSRFVCYDLGLTEQQLISINKHFAKCPKSLDIRKFEFSVYPEVVQLKHKTYSWKPIIVNEMMAEQHGNVLWMDSANIILTPLNNIWNEIESSGQYLPISGSGALHRWTHWKTLELLEVSEKTQLKRNRGGSLCGFSNKNIRVKKLVQEWAELALDWDCIKPEGAGRSNHRDDQSLLTILAYRLEEANLLNLTSDQVNISSGNPIASVSVRNIITRSVHLKLLPLFICIFGIRRFFDIEINRLIKPFR
jgi:hypothetical protein